MDREHKLFCGAAKREITPEPDRLDGLYGLMTVRYGGILDRLFLRVLAFSNGEHKALVISFDLDKAPNPAQWIPEVAQRTGVPEENIVYIGTHTHSAPLTTKRPREDKRNTFTEEMVSARLYYEGYIHKRLIDAVDEALQNLQPARMGVGRGESFINVNRNAEFDYEENGVVYPYVSQGPNCREDVDRTVVVVKVEDMTGKAMAFFINYAVHCCVMFLNRYNGKGEMGISGDIAGRVSQFMEARFPGSVAVWSSGAAGNVNPIIANELFYASPVDGRRERNLFPDSKSLEEVLRMLSARHFEDILRAARSIRSMSGKAEIAGAVEWSETPKLEVDDSQRGVWKVLGDSAAPYRIRMHLVRIGTLAMLGIGGELYDSFGRALKANAPLRDTVVLNHEASLLEDAGYIMDDETIARVLRKTPVSGGVPGGGYPEMKPGYIGPSLLAHEDSLFGQVM